ncbi:MAG: hypothetical protein J5736_04955 [Bacilli bacterium]|nr:hypothetical protein [Bacilli bacterium]
MEHRLCPACGHFGLERKPGYPPEKDAYVCSFCGASFSTEEIEGSVSLNENSIQRFPSAKDAEPESQLNSFLKGKKQ